MDLCYFYYWPLSFCSLSWFRFTLWRLLRIGRLRGRLAWYCSHLFARESGIRLILVFIRTCFDSVLDFHLGYGFIFSGIS